MRAARIHAFGEPLRIDEVPEPGPRPDEVVVRLTHAGVNPLDIRMRDGRAGRVPLPFVPGVEGVGFTAEGRVVVYGAGIGLQRSGTYAEQVSAPPASLVPVPDGVDPLQVAGLGLAGVTAWGVVHRAAGITADDRVLVLGASGGVGSLAIQLARSTGARVWAQTSSAADVALQRDLGAEEVVVGGAAEMRDAVRPLAPTVVLDPLGGEFTAASLRAVQPGGRIVVLGVSAGERSDIDLALLYRKGATIRGHATLAMSTADVTHALVTCLELMAGGKLRVHVDDVLPLGSVDEAHARLIERCATGKVLLSVA